MQTYASIPGRAQTSTQCKPPSIQSGGKPKERPLAPILRSHAALYNKFVRSTQKRLAADKQRLDSLLTEGKEAHQTKTAELFADVSSRVDALAETSSVVADVRDGVKKSVEYVKQEWELGMADLDIQDDVVI